MKQWIASPDPLSRARTASGAVVSLGCRASERPPVADPVLESTAIAFISTIGPTGAPQTTPQWFLWEDGALHFSLVDGRQKLRNLRRDPRLSVVVANPADPTWYVEFRGHVDDLVPDPELALERKIARRVKRRPRRRRASGNRPLRRHGHRQEDHPPARPLVRKLTERPVAAGSRPSATEYSGASWVVAGERATGMAFPISRCKEEA